MNNKKTIVFFYVGIGVFALLIVTGFSYLGDLRKMQAKENEQKRLGNVKDVQVQTVEESIGQYKLLQLDADFTAVNQFGEKVTFQSLKGKVWVFAQFYGSCPECNSTNLAVLKELHQKYGDNENFQIVTISVKPDADAVVRMKSLADHYAPDAKNWWFISADAAEVNQFCQKHMGFMAFKKNKHFGKTTKEGESPQLEILHDMGVAIFGSDMAMWNKVNIADPMKLDDTLAIELAKKKINLTIDWALKQIDKDKKEQK